VWRGFEFEEVARKSERQDARIASRCACVGCCATASDKVEMKNPARTRIGRAKTLGINFSTRTRSDRLSVIVQQYCALGRDGKLYERIAIKAAKSTSQLRPALHPYRRACGNRPVTYIRSSPGPDAASSRHARQLQPGWSSS